MNGKITMYSPAWWATMLPLVTAFAKGEKVQYAAGQGWIDVDACDFHYPAERYRIKPKADEFYAVYNKEGKRLAVCVTHADADTVRIRNPGSTIKMFIEAPGQ